MNVLLIHLEPLIEPMDRAYHIGLAYITSILDKNGHNVSFLPLYALHKNKILRHISKNKTEVIFISVFSDSFELAKKITRFLKNKTGLPVFLGGIHPTVCPEECIDLEGVWGLCIGEGEYPACELVEAIANKKDYSRIKNLWIKKDGVVYKNEIRPLISDLDLLPPPNYEIFKPYKNFSILPMMLTRGCPFDCTYCCNHTFRKLYAGKGKFLRFHSVSYSIELIKGLLKQFPAAGVIEFCDDTFTMNKKWLYNFLEEFAKIPVRFSCDTRFDTIDEDLIKVLARAGCFKLSVGIECGNPKIRKEVLRRDMPDEEIIQKAELIKRYKIELHTHNMVGIPYEEEKDILKTIELNKIIGTDEVQVSVFNPYPKTELAELCAQNNWINKRLHPTSYCDFTVLKTPYIKPHIVNYYFLVFKSLILESGFRLWVKKFLFWIMHIHNNSVYFTYRKLKHIYVVIVKVLRKLRPNPAAKKD